jgi:hypothetical protein
MVQDALLRWGFFDNFLSNARRIGEKLISEFAYERIAIHYALLRQTFASPCAPFENAARALAGEPSFNAAFRLEQEGPRAVCSR